MLGIFDPSKRLFPIVLLVGLAVSIFCLQCFGQDRTIHIDTKLVTVPVVVLDRDGRYIVDLRKGDFRIVEDETEQSIEIFEPVEVRLNVFLLLDVSGSATKYATDIANATSIFVKQLRPEDRISVATFAFEQRVLVDDRKVADLTEKVRIQTYPMDSGTLVYNAVELAIARLEDRRGRKAIMLFSDGVDTGVHTSMERALQKAEEHDVAIYTMHYGFNEPPSPFVDKKKHLAWQKAALHYMRSVATKTGGRYFSIEDISDLSIIFRHVADELVRQYRLGYYPKNTSPGRKQIKVKVARPDVVVRSRESYVVEK